MLIAKRKHKPGSETCQNYDDNKNIVDQKPFEFGRYSTTFLIPKLKQHIK